MPVPKNRHFLSRVCSLMMRRSLTRRKTATFAEPEAEQNVGSEAQPNVESRKLPSPRPETKITDTKLLSSILDCFAALAITKELFRNDVDDFSQ